MLYQFKGCGKCRGDLMLDGDEWRCFQCGRVYYPRHSPMELIPGPPAATSEAETERERPRVRRAARHLNPVLAATRLNERQWWTNNKAVIHHLDQGKKIREIAEIVGKGPRQIRVVRERLRDVRSAGPELVAAG